MISESSSTRLLQIGGIRALGALMPPRRFRRRQNERQADARCTNRSAPPRLDILQFQESDNARLSVAILLVGSMTATVVPTREKAVTLAVRSSDARLSYVRCCRQRGCLRNLSH